MAVRDVTELTVCIKAYRVAMEFFEMRSMHEHSEKFPRRRFARNPSSAATLTQTLSQWERERLTRFPR